MIAYKINDNVYVLDRLRRDNYQWIEWYKCDKELNLPTVRFFSSDNAILWMETNFNGERC